MPAFPEAAQDRAGRTSSCGATWPTPPRHPRPSGPAWSPSCPTGRSCGWPGRRSRIGRCGTSTGLLEQFEASVVAAAAQVHWARDAEEANRIVTDLVRGARRRRGGQGQVDGHPGDRAQRGPGRRRASPRWETDLAELIVQLGDDLPSHILVPAIHRNRAEIREIFLREMAGRPAAPRPHRRAAPAGRGRPAAPAAQVPARQGRASPAPTSRSPRPARWSSSSPRATAGCA